MDSRLTAVVSETKTADLRRRAEGHRSAIASVGVETPRERSPALTMRLASAQDAKELERLAQLDSARTPTGPALVAEVEGEIVAALPLNGDKPVADPFRLTAETLALLELRAAQLRGDSKSPRWSPHRVLRRRQAAFAADGAYGLGRKP